MDKKTHIKHTTNMGKHLNIPVGALRLGADDDASTLATQETSAKNLVYITNIPEGTLDTVKNVQDSSKKTSEQDDKKCSPLEKSDQVTSNDNLNAYRESDRDDDPEKVEECKKNMTEFLQPLQVQSHLEIPGDSGSARSHSMHLETSFSD